MLAYYPLGNIRDVLYSRFIHHDSLTKSEKYGHESEMRLSFRRYWRGNIAKAYESHLVGDEVKLKQILTQDMFVAESNYEVFHGTNGRS